LRKPRVVDRVAWMMELGRTKNPETGENYTKSEAAALAFPSATRHRSLSRAGEGLKRYRETIREKLQRLGGADAAADTLIQGTQAFKLAGLDGIVMPDFTERRLASTDIARIYGELVTGNVNNFFGDEFTQWLVEQVEMAKTNQIEKPMEVQAETLDVGPRTDRPHAVALRTKALPAPKKVAVFASSCAHGSRGGKGR